MCGWMMLAKQFELRARTAMLASIPGMKEDIKESGGERERERIHIMVSLVGHSTKKKNIFSFAWR